MVIMPFRFHTTCYVLRMPMHVVGRLPPSSPIHKLFHVRHTRYSQTVRALHTLRIRPYRCEEHSILVQAQRESCNALPSMDNLFYVWLSPQLRLCYNINPTHLGNYSYIATYQPHHLSYAFAYNDKSSYGSCADLNIVSWHADCCNRTACAEVHNASLVVWNKVSVAHLANSLHLFTYAPTHDAPWTTLRTYLCTNS